MHTFYCLQPYLRVRARYLLSWLRCDRSKIFLPIVVHAKFMEVPQLSWPSLFRDITNCHCGYGPFQALKEDI